jgi:hypothetical protein
VIIDENKNLSSAGTILYNPFLLAANSNTPESIPQLGNLPQLQLAVIHPQEKSI